MIASASGVASQCEVCRQWAGSVVCGDCLSRFAAPVPRCRRCGLRVGVDDSLCGECLRDAPPFETTVCAVDYAFPWSQLVADFKFKDRPELAGPLAAMLVAAWRRRGLLLPERMLPVPLAPSRLAGRGYNQSWEIARRVGAVLGIPASAEWLQRPIDTMHQTELGRRERQRNLRTAFMVDPHRRDALAGRTVALVDDVMTTGATAREAAAQLIRAGVRAVQLWVVARTPAA